jgi:hypothetical protein
MRGLTQCAEHIHSQVISRLSPTPVAIEPELAQASGILRGTAVQMSTQRYSGPGFQSLTIARIGEPSQGTDSLTAGVSDEKDRDELDRSEKDRGASTLTVVGLPWPSSRLPVLGMDLIALRGSLSLVAVDLAPTDPDTWRKSCAPLLLRLRDMTSEVVVPRRLPVFTQGTFSPLALIVAAQPGGEPALFAALLRFIEEVAELYQQAVPPAPGGTDPELTQPAITRWLAAERQNRKEHSALSQIFGDAFAQRYLHGFLFAPPATAEPNRSAP